MHKKRFWALFFILSFFCTSMCAYALDQEKTTGDVLQMEPAQEAFEEDAVISPDDAAKEVKTPVVADIEKMTPNANSDIRKEVLNDTDSNLRFTIKKFLYAMFGVFISSVIIFLILIFMGKLNLIKREEKHQRKPFLSRDDINVPTGENDALRVFFEKTK